ncbi:MAG: MBOAT family O-acyltransferase [Leptospirillia bacterium]
MLFFAYEYIFAFLPVVVLGYFWLCGRRLTTAAQAWLVGASLFYYAWWNPSYLPIILLSILFNWGVSALIHGRAHDGTGMHRAALAFGIFGNLAFLGYFKYTDFLIANVNQALATTLPELNLLLPLGISFFTFQQIAFLVDSHQGVVQERKFLNYMLFVTFFPQLVSGPIVHHKEMMPQFASLRNKVVDYRNITRGLFLFTLGLAKKVLVADTFARWAIAGFGKADSLTLLEGWVTSLSYTFQLYFDFSAYMDMALGAALLFNIRLPFNFNSPYKSLSIQDFWRRWHITLSRFLRDYLYIPLGGNRRSEARTWINLLATFVLGGIWHGAGWTFIFWGFLHGLAAAIHRGWQRLGLSLPKPVAWALTFLFVNAAWVFFRAETWADAMGVLGAMAGLGTPMQAGTLMPHTEATPWVLLLLPLALMVCLFAPNSHEITARFHPSLGRALALGTAAGAIAIYVVVDSTRVTEFIYFGF